MFNQHVAEPFRKILDEIEKPVRTLTCCVCGASTRGRQWWNRDTGYGVCPPCVQFVRKSNERLGLTDLEDSPERLYGIQGIHWDVAEVPSHA